MRRHLLATLVVLVVALPLGAQTPVEVQLCRQLDSPAADPDVRARVEAAVRGTGESALFAQGCLAIADARFGDAERIFEQLVNEDGRSSAYHYYLGRAYGARAQRANVLSRAPLARKTKAAFDRAVQLDPENVDAREGLVRYYSQAPGLLGGSMAKAGEQVVEIRRRNAYRAGIVAADLAAGHKDDAAMQREYEQLVVQYPDSELPHARLVALHARGKQWDDAFRAVDRWLAARPGSRGAQYAVGRTAAESGLQLDRGEQALRKYLGGSAPKPNEPSLAGAHWRLGMIHEQRGQRDAARAEYQAALTLDPALKGAQDALARLK
jgi:tetratricopeptide (TPR) repeat protein